MARGPSITGLIFSMTSELVPYHNENQRRAMTMITPFSLLSSARRASITFGRQQIRDVSVGTDLTKSAVAWQKARPWYMSDAEGSNMAVDNALSMKQVFPKGTVAVFGVPAPFTGTCTNKHYPGYKKLADDFLRAGVDSIVCYTVADPYAHYNWAKALGNDFDKITFLADPDCEWAKATDLDADYSDSNLGVRSKRFSMLVQDGVVRVFHDLTGGDAAADAETLLADAKQL